MKKSTRETNSVGKQAGKTGVIDTRQGRVATGSIKVLSHWLLKTMQMRKA